MTTKHKFDKSFLIEFCKKNNITYEVKDDKIKQETVIKGTCISCPNYFEKSFRSLVDKGGPYCNLCSENNRLTKIKKTCLEKYGVDNPFKSEDIKQKIKEVCLEKYGVENPGQSDEIKQKIKEVCIQKYGVENAFQSDEIKQKIKETCMKKYGVEYALQSQKSVVLTDTNVIPLEIVLKKHHLVKNHHLVNDAPMGLEKIKMEYVQKNKDIS
jgi:glutathione peroxidase-family protein